MQIKTPISGLHLIICTNPKHNYLDLALMAIEGGIDSLQLRHKKAYTRTELQLAFQLAELCRSKSIPFIVNDRLDIAMAVGAHGVHLGQTDLPIYIARRLLGPDAIIGATASTVDQAIKAQSEGADYIGLGHIYHTQTKVKDYPPVGTEILKTLCQKISIPVLAIGGIKSHHLPDVCQTGVSGVAIVSAIRDADNPLEETLKFKQGLKHHAKRT